MEVNTEGPVFGKQVSAVYVHRKSVYKACIENIFTYKNMKTQVREVIIISATHMDGSQ